MRLLISTILVFVAACASISDSRVKPKGFMVSSARPSGEPFKPGEVLGCTIHDAKGRAIGRSHSVYQRSKTGLLHIRTRLVANGESTEHALTFSSDRVPVRYKRLSSMHGKYGIDFRGEQMAVFDDDRDWKISGSKPTHLPVPFGDMMALIYALGGEKLEPGSSTKLAVFDVDRLRTTPWTVSAYLDAKHRTVVSLVNGTLTLGRKGEMVSFESANGWKFLPQDRPQAPPNVSYRARLKYRQPKSPPWKDRFVTVGARAGVLSIPENLSRWLGLRAPLLVLLSDVGNQDRYGMSERIDRGTWEIQDYLLEQGYAVLRLDDDTDLETSESLKTLIEFMSHQPDVDAERLVVLGHGEGGWMALRAGLMFSQQVTAVGLFGTPWKAMSSDLKKSLGSSQFQIGVFQGLKDFEVSWKKDTKAMIRALESRSAGKKLVKSTFYSRVDHFMKEEPKTSNLERYQDRNRRVDRGFLKDLSQWLDTLMIADAQN